MANLAQGGTPDQIYKLFELDGIAPMCKALASNNNDLIVNIMLTLHTMLSVLFFGRIFQFLSYNHFQVFKEFLPEYYDALMIAIEEAEGIDQLERLQNHENTKIYDLAYKLIDDHFTDENDV